MKIFVKLFTILEPYGEGKIGDAGSVDVAEGTTLRDLSDVFDMPPKPAKVYLVNRLSKKDDYIVEESDDVKILTFIGGG